MKKINKMFFSIFLIGLLSLFCFLSPEDIIAFTKPIISPAPDFDIRQTSSQTLPMTQKSISINLTQEKAINAIKEKIKDVKIERSALTGSPRRIMSRTTSLTGSSTAPAKDIAMNFLMQNLNLFNLSTQDMIELKIILEAKAKNSGVTYLSIQQQVNSMDVFGAVININIDKEGRILNINGELIPGIHDIVNTDIPILSEQEAIEKASSSAHIINMRYTKVYGLVYFPLSLQEARLAWNVLVEDADSQNVYQTIVDAIDGTVLFRQNHTQYAHGLVYTSDSPDPDTPTGTSDCTTNPYPACAVDRVDVDFDGRDFFSLGDDHYDWWNDGTGSADTSTTKSNNAHAKEDSDYDNDDTEGFPTITGDDFSFVIDLSQEPTVEDASVQNRSSGIVNVFYWVNRIHDIYYSLGFDESERNFQSDNFGLGGTGGDQVQVDIHDRLSTTSGYIYHCNAGFSSTPTDGDPVRMTMLLCDNATPETDAALENLIIIHEYTHGLVKRLVHNLGPYSSQSGGLQDGTCDFMGLAITSEPDDDLTQDYPRGQWYYNNVNGNRRQPYSTNQSVFTRTYADIADDPSPWPAGEIWCNTLWMARANLVWKHGFTTGRDTILQLVVDGMKNERNHPDYLDMRDGILLADNTNNGGVNQCILWDAFAKMGMGFFASTTGDTDNNPTEDFDIPVECVPDIRIEADQDFGNLCIGETQENQLQIYNDDDTGDLIVSSITKISGSPDITVEPLPHPVFVDPGAHEDFLVRCSPTTCGSKEATMRIESNDPDQPQLDLTFTCDGDTLAPVLLCPEDIAIECDEITDPSNTGEATATDNCDSDPTVNYTDVITDPTPSCPSDYLITRTWTAEDECENVTSCDQVITVEDTTPPTITDIVASPNNLWPPNHKMVPISVAVTATDNCGEPVCSITAVVSNEPVNGLGDGNTAPDWEIDGDLTVKLRAERSGTGSGRVYTITTTCDDGCGNNSSGTVDVTVSHDQGK
jgi:hypothetical protein